MKVVRSNNSSSIIGNIYLDCVKEFQGCPIKLITDLGTENVLAAAPQTYFRQDVNAHYYVSSTRNQRIESWQSFFTKGKGRWWKHFFLDLGSNGRLGMTSLSFTSIIQSDSECIATESNPTNEYQEYFEYKIFTIFKYTLKLENPSSYQQG